MANKTVVLPIGLSAIRFNGRGDCDYRKKLKTAGRRGFYAKQNVNAK
ncbi:MAG: hypothetical protein PF694_06130 [Bacteroidetes bacterium]|nr:hypothetical protein [Bacteroidota bacterium]